ncbi:MULTISPECIES: hypothetical protein [Paenibacillus]|uniref:Dynamin family protein n=1 Tax=Paenibacillus pabuli TaxID=1472 RepID=A0A855Y5I6_9BACL|nr:MULTISPECIES: hypothetical protein [Paenibacillus]PWW37891.1 hypothetical protein DET56_10884 [Paenibacillus pabuli]PXW08118.1 hypothetical protein DEU73_10484 [Paenibacillus taichungensis]
MFENNLEFEQSSHSDAEEHEKLYPTVAVVGGSKEGKSTAIAGLAHQDFREGMLLFSGDGNTTSCISEIIINPNLYTADVEVIALKEREEIFVDIGRHMKASLVPEMKNCLSSRPKKESEHDRFYADVMEKRLIPVDATFRIDKLLQNDSDAWDQYKQIMITVLKSVDQQADEEFRKNYFDLLKSEKEKFEAQRMIDTLIDQKLFPDQANTNNVAEKDNTVVAYLNELCNLIYEKAVECLGLAGFQVDEINFKALSSGKNAEDFKKSVQAVTNSKKVMAPSAACVIKAMKIRIPGPGLRVKSSPSEVAYRVYDVVGFDNDGVAKIPDRVKEALLTPVMYDAILFVKSATSAPAKNRDYLAAIQHSVRPSKLIVAVTHLDHANVFDQDEDPTSEQIQNQISTIKTDTLAMIESVIDKDCQVKLPERPDIICFANTARKKKLGDEGVTFLKENDPYPMLRTVISRAYDQVRTKINSTHHNIVANQREQFFETKEPVHELIGHIIANLTSRINEEYSDLRDLSYKLHHWTVDAILWNLYQGRSHVSYAQVWENVSIKTFSNFVNTLMENLTPSNLASGVIIRGYEDRVKREFESNLNVELIEVARKLLLESEVDSKTSECKQTILKLARTPKYNKWKIFDDLRKSLLTAVSQQNYLELLLNRAITNANLTTYSRLFL